MRAMTKTLVEPADELWAEEPSNLAGHARLRARISGLHCSLCTGTIEKALIRQDGVDTVAVSLSHEQALVDYDPAVIEAQQILGTLRDIGYDLYDPRKLRPFEEEEAELVKEGKRLLTAIAASLLAIGLIADISGFLSVLVPASVVVVMVPVAYALLRPQGRRTAVAGAVAIVAPALLALGSRAAGTASPTEPVSVPKTCARRGISGATMNACAKTRNAAATNTGSSHRPPAAPVIESGDRRLRHVLRGSRRSPSPRSAPGHRAASCPDRSRKVRAHCAEQK